MICNDPTRKNVFLSKIFACLRVTRKRAGEHGEGRLNLDPHPDAWKSARECKEGEARFSGVILFF